RRVVTRFMLSLSKYVSRQRKKKTLWIPDQHLVPEYLHRASKNIYRDMQWHVSTLKINTKLLREDTIR
ncbi:hypothetical protein MYX76_14845, partial [Desulfobacterota bacterium AH_259_B03_O07]|nr:hypothetical protein [Desulfobacterota bacterium AH_259_B03_O07]